MGKLLKYYIIIILFIFISTMLHALVDATYIEPGDGVGAIKINQTINKIYIKLAGRKSDKMETVLVDTGNQEKEVEFWYHYYELGLVIIYCPEVDDSIKKNEPADQQKIILKSKRIIVTNRGIFVKDTSLRVGEKITALKNYGYGKPADQSKVRILKEDDKKNPLIEAWDYPEEGLSIWIDKKAQVIYAIEVREKEVGN